MLLRAPVENIGSGSRNWSDSRELVLNDEACDATVPDRIVNGCFCNLMAQSIPIGVRGEAVETVELKHTLAVHHPELPPVYSTPDMIRLMETACFRALQPYCDDGEITV